MHKQRHRIAARSRELALGTGTVAALAAIAAVPALGQTDPGSHSSNAGNRKGASPQHTENRSQYGGSRSHRPTGDHHAPQYGGFGQRPNPQRNQTVFQPGNLLLSSSTYEEAKGLKAGETQLAPGCTLECFTADASGKYPEVWNNDSVDEDFGVSSKIFLNQLTPAGQQVNSLEVPNSTDRGITSNSDQMVTSFSSKSELALNLSTGGKYVTFMGYLSPVDALDVSNGNTPAVVDPTNPDPVTAYRVVAQVDSEGHFHFTETNAYSGNNGRAAILNEEEGADSYYLAGNAGNGSKPIDHGVITGGGAQILKPSLAPEFQQDPGEPTSVGSFNITELGDKADKPSKDNNYRGITIANKVLYYTKGSGSNGVNTVYFVNTSGKGCTDGVGLPEAGAKLPTSAITPTVEGLEKEELAPTNMCILKGFTTTLNKTEEKFHPFGLWFANADTLYVADEGNGESGYSTSTGEYTEAAAQTVAGLQKWVFDAAAGEWKLAYTLTNGLDLGKPYTVPGYPTGDNPLTNKPWAPGTDGLRNVTGRVNSNGTVSIWATTSTVSGNGDEGADPNKLVEITDPLDATTAPSSESFQTLRTAGFEEVLRGVSFTPGTGEPASFSGHRSGRQQGQGQQQGHGQQQGQGQGQQQGQGQGHGQQQGQGQGHGQQQGQVQGQQGY